MENETNCVLFGHFYQLSESMARPLATKIETTSSYLHRKNSTQLLHWFEELGVLQHNAYLFTADANSMYTNIDTNHAIKVISEWLDSLHLNNQLPANFPLKAVKEAMMLVIKNNIFEWGELHFLQLLGTVMGTSAACICATIYFAVHEMGTLIPKYGNRLPLFGQLIYDIIGV